MASLPYEVLVTGRKRGQAATRATMTIVEERADSQQLRINRWRSGVRRIFRRKCSAVHYRRTRLWLRDICPLDVSHARVRWMGRKMPGRAAGPV